MSAYSCESPPKKGLSASVQELQADRLGELPVWVRAPKSGQRERYTAVSRSKLYEWADAGLIVSRSIRSPGRVRGVRLFSLPSLMEFIERSETGGRRSEAGVATEVI